MIASLLGAATEAAFVASLAAGEFTLAELSGPDWARCAELVDLCSDMGLGLVDASVVALAERLRIITLAASTVVTCSWCALPTAKRST